MLIGNGSRNCAGERCSETVASHDVSRSEYHRSVTALHTRTLHFRILVMKTLLISPQVVTGRSRIGMRGAACQCWGKRCTRRPGEFTTI